MAKGLKRPRMPKWLWHLQAKHFNSDLKRFLAWFWFCGPRGCDSWNYKLARRFHVQIRTIQRWLHRLKQLRLITIRQPCGRWRTVFAAPYFSRQVWLEKAGLVTPAQGTTQMSSITTSAQQIPQEVSAAAQPDSDNGSKAVKIPTRGAVPPLPPAVQEGRARLLTPEELVGREQRLAYLMNSGLDYKQAYSAVHLEWLESFTPREVFFMDEMMEFGLDYSGAFDLILEERTPGSVKWLNHHTKSKL